MLDAAATLFALHGIDAVSLRDIAARADVHLALIRRYVGTRAELVAAVFAHLSDKVARAVVESPLSGQGFEPDTAMGQWVRVAGALVIAGQPVGPSARFNPRCKPWPAPLRRGTGSTPGPRGCARRSPDVAILDGGLNGWTEAGLPTNDHEYSGI